MITRGHGGRALSHFIVTMALCNSLISYFPKQPFSPWGINHHLKKTGRSSGPICRLATLVEWLWQSTNLATDSFPSVSCVDWINITNYFLSRHQLFSFLACLKQLTTRSLASSLSPCVEAHSLLDIPAALAVLLKAQKWLKNITEVRGKIHRADIYVFAWILRVTTNFRLEIPEELAV